jgi:uncharacterized repeat protein (TIGR03803 family)
MRNTVPNCGWLSGVRGRAAGMMVAIALGIVLQPAVSKSGQAEESAQAPTYTVLYSFKGGTQGYGPEAGVVRDAAGNLYGTTCCGGGPSFAGVVFKLDTAGKETLLHSFAGYPTDGADAFASLVGDAAGNFYGTSPNGGASGDGVVFKLDMAGRESVLFSFKGAVEGGNPVGGLVRDAAGNLYGTARSGGATGCSGQGCGVVFKLDPTGNETNDANETNETNETVLHSFAGPPADGGVPFAGLIRDAAGNLYGTTFSGGASGQGVVFKLDTDGEETILHSFAGSPTDGAKPRAGLVRDTAGNLYGTTFSGGASGNGVVFKLDMAGKETILHSFAGPPTDGARPVAGLVRDAAGNLYGTTFSGGTSGSGVVFKLNTAGKETILHSFPASPTDGAGPWGGLVRDAAGNLYGTTQGGGASGQGVVFKLTP